VTSAAVPTKNASSKFSKSSGRIFSSLVSIFSFSLAI